jgi:hypothetical protein
LAGGECVSNSGCGQTAISSIGQDSAHALGDVGGRRDHPIGMREKPGERCAPRRDVETPAIRSLGDARVASSGGGLAAIAAVARHQLVLRQIG